MLLATDLKFNETLCELNLMSNNLGPRGAVELAGALEANMVLTALDLSDNNLADHGNDLTGVQALASALSSNWVLLRVDLRYNPGLELGSEALMDARERRSRQQSSKPLAILL